VGEGADAMAPSDRVTNPDPLGWNSSFARKNRGVND
jgi:hypothetical protein